MSSDQLWPFLAANLGKGRLRLRDDVSDSYTCDWSGLDGNRPKALLLPENVGEVSRSLVKLSQFGQTVVPQGGRTGMAGGATPRKDDVAICLEQMVGVEEIDSRAATITLLAGTTLGAAQVAARGEGWQLGLDLGSRDRCQIGGNLATNAGGTRVLRFGTARQQVTGVEAVLADGSIVSDLGKLLKNNTGYDLKHLFVGSEGTLGIITRAVMRLYPIPPETTTVLCAMSSFDAAVGLLRSLGRETRDLQAFEVMWPSFYGFVVDGLGLRPPVSRDNFLFVLFEVAGLSGSGRDVDRALDRASSNGSINDAVVASSQHQAAEFWSIREGAPIDRLPMLQNYDIGVPVAEMEQFVIGCDPRLSRRWPESTRFWFGHAADGNLHLSISIGNVARSEIEKLDDLVYHAVGEAVGSVSAEHGIGRLKKPYLGLSRSVAELELMRRLKTALDPQGIMNPGKVL